jgi:hypothetical protein
VSVSLMLLQSAKEMATESVPAWAAYVPSLVAVVSLWVNAAIAGNTQKIRTELQEVRTELQALMLSHVQSYHNGGGSAGGKGSRS